MTRKKYLKELEENLISLGEEEKSQALHYYSDYFEEACDDEKVMAELGEPEELAKKIKGNVTESSENVPQVDKLNQNEEDKDNKSMFSDALYFDFDKEKVKNISFNFGAAQVVVINGQKYEIETRGVSEDSFHCHLSPEGNLSVTNERKVNLNFFNHDRKNRIIPRILITVPEGAVLGKLKINIGAGSFETRDVNIKCFDSNFEVGAGNLNLKNVYGGKINVRCGMGNFFFEGKTTGVSNIDCGMGSVKINVKGNPSFYTYDAKVGLGDFKFNDQKKSGVCQIINEEKKENHFSVNCGMGSVVIKIEE